MKNHPEQSSSLSEFIFFLEMNLLKALWPPEGSADSKVLYIYIYTFSRRFYPKRLQVIHFCQYVCSLGIEPTTFCAVNTMLYHWATGTFNDIWHLFLLSLLGVYLLLLLLRVIYYSLYMSSCFLPLFIYSIFIQNRLFQSSCTVINRKITESVMQTSSNMRKIKILL